jgi:hypothetical protein
MAWDYVSELRPPMGLLLIPPVIDVYGVPVESHWQGKTEELGENPASVTLSTTNSKWTDLCANTDLSGERPATNHLSHGTAELILYAVNAN